MKKLLVSIFVIIIGGGITAQVAPKTKVRQIHLEYRSSNKTLELKDTSLVVTEKKDVFDNPVSSIPSSSTFEDKNYTLTKKEVYDLVKFIQDSKFFDMNSEYGAPETERHYPTRLKIKMHGKEKEVVYRSHPSFASPPEAFNKIQKYILDLRK